MAHTDDAPDTGRYGAPEVLIYDSRTAAGQAVRMLMDLMPGVARVVKLRHVAGMDSGPPPEALQHGLPMYIRYDARSRAYTNLHGVEAARAMLDRGRDLVAKSSGVSRQVRAMDAIVATEAAAQRALSRSQAVLRRESDDVSRGYFWAVTGSDFASTPEEVKARLQVRRAARLDRTQECRKAAFDESEFQFS